MTPFDASRDILGRDKEISFFRHLIKENHMAHGWLITGPAGIGKMTFCLSVARVLLKGEDQQSRVSRHITHNTHNDLLVISLPYDEKRKIYKNEIPVSSIRMINNFLHKTTSEGGWRVVIIHHSDKMNKNASNALLKILEEPPNKTVFFLTASATAKLLPTLRSRCRQFQLPPLEEEILYKIVELLPEEERDVLKDKEKFSQFCVNCKGRPGKLLDLIGRDKKGIENLVEKSFSCSSKIQTLTLIDDILKEGNGFSEYFLSILGRLEDMGRNIVLKEGHDGHHIAMSWSRLLKIYHTTNQYNLDKRQSLIEAMAIVSTI